MMPDFPLEGKYVAMLAPSFVVEFEYPSIVWQLKDLGFDKVVELTFGAKMINREYHKQLKNSKKLIIASPCPGVTENIKAKFPQYLENLAKIDSPVEATAKICRKIYPGYKTVFISPCNYKKIEAENSRKIDHVIDYGQLRELLKKYNLKKKKKKTNFDSFYNNYTKIFPISGGLGKTAHLKGIIKEDEILVLEGVGPLFEFLKNPDPKIRFLDALFCYGGCVGGPCVSSKLGINQRKKKVLEYLDRAKKEDIPELKKGTIERAKGIKFTH